MDKHDIGIDATHGEHIETAKQRSVTDNDKLVPGLPDFLDEQYSAEVR